MEKLKELRFIDPTSMTIMGTGIGVIFSIILSIIAIIVFTAYGQAVIALYLVPTLIFGGIIYGIFANFIFAFLYNVLAKKINCVQLKITSEGEITNIAPVSSSLILSLIGLIMTVILYLATLLLMSGIFSTVISICLYSGVPALMNVGYTLYYLMIIYANLTPLFIILLLIGMFIISFVLYLVMCLLYNVLSGKIGGAKIKLTQESGISTLESIDIKSTSIIYAIISLIIGLIFGIIIAITTGNYFSIVSNAIGSAIGGLIAMALISFFYNLLAKKLDKVKVELL